MHAPGILSPLERLGFILRTSYEFVIMHAPGILSPLERPGFMSRMS